VIVRQQKAEERHRRPGFVRLADALKRSRAVSERRRAAFWALLAASAVVLSFVAWPAAKAHLQALAVAKLVGGQPVPGIVRVAGIEAITTEDLNFEIDAGGGRARQTVRARLYLPESAVSRHPGPAMLVFHGVHHLGIDEPRLEAFAAAMASCGVRVLTPELPDIKDYHVDADSIRTIGESATWFANQTGGPVGVMGLSFSGGLALVAAADPVYARSFKFVFAVGAQDSMVRVSDYYRTGRDARPNGTVELLPPHPYGPLVLEYEYVEDFVPPSDVAAVRSVLRGELYEDKAARDAAMTTLNPVQKIETEKLLAGSSPEVRALITASNLKHVAELEGLSPQSHLKSIKVPVYLLHGEADNIIPSAETLWLEQELPRESLRAALISPVISHIDFESSQPTAWDQWRLVHFFALVVQAAERP